MNDNTENTTTTITEPTCYVRYWRKSTPKGASEYDKHEASVSVPVPVKPDGKPDIAAIEDVLGEAKLATWQALDIEFEYVDGKLVEKVAAPTPVVQAAAAGGGGGVPRPPAPPRAANGGGGVTCGVCGGATWDNSDPATKRNPKGPDYKCKDRDNCGAAMWLNDDGTHGKWKS